VNRFISDLKRCWDKRPFVWQKEQDSSKVKIHIPSKGRVMALGPHPDDPESAAVTCRLLSKLGCEIYYAIATFSPSGVDDEYVEKRYGRLSLPLEDKKIEIRRMEQNRSADLFGLPPDRTAFLDIKKKGKTALIDTKENRFKIMSHMELVDPDIVILPTGNDTNQTHAWVCRVFRECAKSLAFNRKQPIVAMYNQDPKTTTIRNDLFVLFDEEMANWKRALLKAHDSQQQRNLSRNGTGFDERILQVNAIAYKHYLRSFPSDLTSQGYAEAFEIELFDWV
jgi:LmbE family N-acetylglucosaminyl deacetylase